MPYDAYLRGLPLMAVSPARRVAYEVLLRVFEQDAYADRVFRSAAEGLDERERAFAQRLAYGAVQRMRTLDYAIDTLGKRPVRKLDPPVRAALRLGAYQVGYTDTPPHAAANESVELVRRAKLERAVPFTNAVMRRLTEGMGALLRSLPDGPLKESYPDWIFETWVRDLGQRGCARAHARGERAARDRDPRRARRSAVRRAGDRHPGGVSRRARRRSRRRRGSHLAAEPRLAARRPRRRLAGRRPRARRLLRARRQDDPAPRRGDRGRARPESRERAARERPAPRRDERHRRRGRRHGAAARAPGLRPRARRRAVLGARRPGAASRPALAREAAAGAPARPAALGGRARSARRHDRLLGVHDQRRRERGDRRCERPRGAAADGRMAAVRAPASTGVPAHAAACPRNERLLHRASASCRPARSRRIAPGSGLERMDPDGRDRAVAVRGGLCQPRRADRRAAAHRRTRLPLRRR